MSLSLKRWLLVALVAMVLLAAFVAAQDDDDADDQPVDADVDADAEVEDVEDDKEEVDTTGLKASAYFPKYADQHIPAGERVEILVPVSNAAGNAAYEVTHMSAFVGSLDHQRFIQNFSQAAYSGRRIEAGETATIKYSVTPDALLDPNEYSFVVNAFVRSDDNTTLLVNAFNGTMVVTEPLGFDFKGTFTLLVFVGGIVGGIYYYVNNKAPAPRKVAKAAAVSSPTRADKGEIDHEFVDPSHLAYLKAKTGRGRSASPKK